MLLLVDNNIMWYCKNVTKRIPVRQQQEQPRRHHYSSKIHTVPIYLEEINGFNYFHSIFVEYTVSFL